MSENEIDDFKKSIKTFVSSLNMLNCFSELEARKSSNSPQIQANLKKTDIIFAVNGIILLGSILLILKKIKM